MIEVQASRAAKGLGALLTKVLTGEDILITRSGDPIATLTRQLERPSGDPWDVAFSHLEAALDEIEKIPAASRGDEIGALWDGTQKLVAHMRRPTGDHYKSAARRACLAGKDASVTP